MRRLAHFLLVGLSVLGTPMSSIAAPFAEVVGTSTNNCTTCTGGVETLVHVRLGSVDRTIPIKHAYMNEVQETHIIDESTGLVIGKASRDVSSISILDLKAASDSLDFLALWPSLSPSGRYLTYVRFFPIHQPGPKSTAVYMLLDLYDPNEWKNPLIWGGPAPGKPFYPPENAQRNSAFPLASADPGPGYHTMVSSNFHWLNDTTVVFTDLTASGKLLVTMSVGASGPIVSTKPAD